MLIVKSFVKLNFIHFFFKKFLCYILILNYFSFRKISCPNSFLNHIKLRATINFVLMHSGIVNGHKLLCDAHAVSEQHRATMQLYFYFTHYCPFPLFLLMCRPTSFLGASIVCVSNLKREVVSLVIP